ncbi:hypothetical protein PG999_014071 [Apiospora kogelbergensis]|uniref:NAD(P)-dependent dehydrogenase, short-chain alcohol dehydrogenase family n=1 Tax=Apiospora kogelbergensis TaxID=1337665 RepID=A0AAW0QMG3_9PEZI
MPRENVVDLIRQSKPIDVTRPVRSDDVRGRTIVITGGASGFGASFARHWAAHGAYLILGDIQDQAGEALVAELRSIPGASPHQHYRHCDVASWESQDAFFRDAVSLSPHGGLDDVVANAGVSDNDFSFCRAEEKRGAGKSDATTGPDKPDLKCLDINLVGTAYTAHLAMYWLARNPGSTASALGRPRTPGGGGPPHRDRHLLLVGSVASLWPVAQATQYTASKHAVLGLFRALRGVAGWQAGVRVNLLCPYIVATGIVPPVARVALAGAAVGHVDAAVEAGTRLVADASIVGRALVVGPKVRVRDDGETYEVTELLAQGGFAADHENGRGGEMAGRGAVSLRRGRRMRTTTSWWR